ncbi:hypothetical protein PGTUg99_003859 [Puccinia graminis f. sp. tritici]|uniref:Uncharacterized protein n=1 Tax=Puccinia graminis f. sp. tritici TaxID=56615 RepID=A0A5B0Q3N0_PUCGR|nr:hypothetical protein PGTUg99_003859 [Puccinia graminis f. sp. tritici]
MEETFKQELAKTQETFKQDLQTMKKNVSKTEQELQIMKKKAENTEKMNAVYGFGTPLNGFLKAQARNAYLQQSTKSNINYLGMAMLQNQQQATWFSQPALLQLLKITFHSSPPNSTCPKTS